MHPAKKMRGAGFSKETSPVFGKRGYLRRTELRDNIVKGAIPRRV